MKYIAKLKINKDQLNLINKNVVIRKLNIISIEDIYSIKDLILNNQIINLSCDLLKDYKNTLNEQQIKKLEFLISKDSEYSYLYAKDVIKGPWERGENAISKHPKYSYYYARDVIKGPFQQGEDIISGFTRYSYDYSRFIIKGPWEKGEDAISKNAMYSYLYAKDMIKGSWEKGEDAISKNPHASYLYARDVIKGPFEKGHPMMFNSEHQEIQEEEYEQHKNDYIEIFKIN